MRIPFAILPLLATLNPLTLAFPVFSSSLAGSSVPYSALTVTWSDNGDAPKISTLDTYTLNLILGSDTAGPNQVVFPLTTGGNFANGNSAKGTLTATQAASTKNGFYFQMVATSSTSGGTYTAYSDRFTVTGLTGVTPPNAAKAVTGGTAGPQDVNGMTPAAGQADPAAGVVPAAGDYGTPFNEQSGTIRYAPMQPFPPNKISKKGKPKPQYPTSAYNVALERMPPPTVVTTITESQTFHAMTMENTVAPQSHPKDDMAKFLARWKD